MSKYKYPMVLVHAIDLSTWSGWHSSDSKEEHSPKDIMLVGWLIPTPGQSYIRLAMVYCVVDKEVNDDWVIPKTNVKSIQRLTFTPKDKLKELRSKK